MITYFNVRNFKSLVDLRESFRPQAFNVIVGPNGSGKSSLLQSLDFLRAFFMSSVEVYLREKGWQYNDLPNLRQTRKSIEWHIEATLDGSNGPDCAGHYDYSITLAPRRYLSIGNETLKYTPLDGTPILLLKREGRKVQIYDRKNNVLTVGESYSLPASVISTLNSASDRARYPELLHFRRWVERFRYFLIWDTKTLRNPDRGRHEELGPSGEHLAPLLALLKQNHPDRFDRLLSLIKRLFPYVTDVSVTGGRTWGWRNIQLHEKDAAFNSQQMSDGVLRLLAIASLLYVEKPPSVVMLEEPEDGVHPQLIREVVQVLRQLSLRKAPNACQVFFTTHSPYVLDEFYDSPEEVFIMEKTRPKEGATVTTLSTASQLGRMRAAFERSSLGELWYSGLLGGTAGVSNSEH